MSMKLFRHRGTWSACVLFMAASIHSASAKARPHSPETVAWGRAVQRQLFLKVYDRRTFSAPCTVVVTFLVAHDGAATNPALRQSSCGRFIGDTVAADVNRASPFPAPPPGLSDPVKMTVTIDIFDTTHRERGKYH